MSLAHVQSELYRSRFMLDACFADAFLTILVVVPAHFAWISSPSASRPAELNYLGR
ncbi:hypothetical protein SynMVIR181_00815 [Synechococcus sp. MVIR-18-1]|nr:hypothetical protein SynMVIR181_00815 [Synechococcus sp. MVIR-18-1]